MAVTWKLLRTTHLLGVRELLGHQASLGRRGDRVELAAEHEHGHGRVARSAGSGGPAGLSAGATGQRVHQSSDCQSERAYSRTVNGP